MVIVQRIVDTTAYRAIKATSLFGFAESGETARLHTSHSGWLRNSERLLGCAAMLPDGGYLAMDRNGGAQRDERNDNPRYWGDTVIRLADTGVIAAVSFDGSNPATGKNVRCLSRVRRRSPQ